MNYQNEGFILKNKSKPKIRIHRYENIIWGRSHLPFFKKFDKYLSNFFDVELINYNTDGDTFVGKINLECNSKNEEQSNFVSDVDCVIQNMETQDVKIISFGEYFNNYICHTAKIENCSKVLLAHFNWQNVYFWMKRENLTHQLNKIKPWIFLPYQEFDSNKYRKLRDETEDFEEKLFFLGPGINDYRKVIGIINEKGYTQTIEGIDHEQYLERMSKSKIAIGYYTSLDRYNTPFDYPGEFCYRDIEYAIIGVPFIRIEYKDTLHNPLLPNVHYISIPREKAYVAYEKYGDDGVANLYIEKYNEIKNDNIFLKYISENLRKWSDENILNGNAEKLTFELLELNKWINK
jgi:hypothetical protein